ncbi:MAG: hypothetical protein QOI63_523 [Thermoplasmata archaeon]|nr:hypothetical protein [Thermoplasmata archaeon]
MLRLVAVVAVAGLALSGAFMALAGHTAPAAVKDPAKQEMTTRSTALAQLNSLAGLPDATAAIHQATATSAQVLGEAGQPVAAAVADAQAQLGDVLKGLAALPAGYVPGMDVSGLVQAVKPAAFPLPAFNGRLEVGAFRTSAILADPSPVVARGLHLPGQSLGQLGDLGNQLGVAYGTLQDALKAIDTSAVTGAVPGGLPVVGSLPGLGGAPAQAQDANDAADPDEQGAILAGAHAGKLLGSVEAAYALSQPSLAGLLAGYQGLAAQVQTLVDEAHNTTAQATVTIQDTLDARVAALKEAVDAAQAKAMATVAAQRQAVEAAVAGLQAELKQVVDAQSAAVQAAVQADLDRLNGLAAQLPAVADAAKDKIQSTVDVAVGELSHLQGMETTASVQAIQAAGAAAMQKLIQDTLARTQALKQAAADLQARGEATIATLTEAANGALPKVQALAAKTVAKADDLSAYVVDLARAQAAAAQTAERAAAQAALDQVAKLELAQVAKVTKLGLQLTAATGPAMQSVDALVTQVGTAASGEVEKDIGYVAKVSKDYAKVPTGDRMERAHAWSTVAGLAGGRLDKVLATTQALDDLAGQVLNAASAAKAQIEAMA